MAWFDEAIVYHIYPLGLSGAPKQNAYEKPAKRLNKIVPWLDHIQKLNANTLLIGPVFESVGHGYETTAYDKVDSRLGTNEDLKKFVKEAHKRGIRVVLDAVYNHVGRDFWAFKDLQKNKAQSAYVSWFAGVNFDNDNYHHDGFSYDTWRGYDTLVRLNLENPVVRDYLLEVTTRWIKEFDIDGLRLDSADVLNFDFMHELRETTTSVKEDFWLMGEVIHGEYNRWEGPGLLHAVTNYSLHQGLFNAHNTHNYFEIAHTVNRNLDMGNGDVLGLRLYNFLDNQDVSRIVSKLQNQADLLPAYALLYTLPGIPSVYYGSEFALAGERTDTSDDMLRPALKLADYKDAFEKNALTKYIQRLGDIRRSQDALNYGAYRELYLTNEQYAFARITDTDAVIVAVNNADSPATVSVDALGRPGYKDPLSEGTQGSQAGQDGQDASQEEQKTFEAADWQVSFEIPAHGARILVQTARPAGL